MHLNLEPGQKRLIGAWRGPIALPPMPAIQLFFKYHLEVGPYNHISFKWENISDIANQVDVSFGLEVCVEFHPILIQVIGQQIPDPSENMLRADMALPSRIVGHPVLGGLHHDYRRAA
jgi:hypothetical protein